MYAFAALIPRVLLASTCALVLILLAACQTAPNNTDWLYRQLGERDGISRLNETFLLNIARDDRISPIFEDTDIILLHKRLTEQFCVLAGGPCTYGGESMYDVHRDLHLTSTDFNALVEDLIKAMESEQVSVAAQNRLLALLAPMRRNIVGTQPPPPVEMETSGVGDLPLSGYSASP
ncbi:group 1 truncated hemoglobin [Salinisphaera aquimarina]